ncbi:CHU large protein/ candidate b-glycosidase, glycoside hydrolase family 8 protein [Candidatus Vecturithrix granuli]|uniref:CHU large protein/ candidate b-glycosidase, glycoside hydrolase family 8 protein n=1 Tax=Vecturithrix granuli TaxID=1499967 RepID=A0A081C3N7_VECG1|nr:CHU large protein/ candidate b-glycosidase, glycoside hydrolase family 8 protein [Candidatus Vecturithrix granuli]
MMPRPIRLPGPTATYYGIAAGIPRVVNGTTDQRLTDITDRLLLLPLPRDIFVYQGTTFMPRLGSYTFGTVVVGSSSPVVTFTIENLGYPELHLTSTPAIQLGGTNPGDFSVTQPASTTLGPSRTTTFTVTFTPTTTGPRTATVSIANDDDDESSYTFTVNGTGQAQGSNSYLLWTK